MTTETTLSGMDLLHDAASNKGTAFSEQERQTKNLKACYRLL